MYCGNNPIGFVDWLGLKDVKLRDYVEEHGGKVTWNENERSAYVDFGSAGSITYYAKPYKYNPSDTSSSLYPHMSWNADGTVSMVIDDNIIKNDFGIIDTESRSSDGMKVVATLFDQQGKKYQRITINGWEVEHKTVKYNSFNFYVTGGRGRYTIGIGHPTKQEVNYYNKEYRADVNDTIDVLGSDPTFSSSINFVFSIIGLVRTPTYPEEKLSLNDYRISFNKSVFYIDRETNMLIRE